ncbi:MAG TPA: TRAP transporter large permease subunit [Casimicrobiaceae bacterium]|nr:TRAP transporter large permease subunit [Casimicrobiaceae bacterium]
MSVLGLALLAAVALLVPLTGLPAFAVLLAMAVAGALIGVASGAIDPPLLSALPGRLINLLESDLLQALPLYVFIGALLVRLPIADALYRSSVRLLGGRPQAPGVAAIAIGTLLGPMNGSVGASVVAMARAVAPHLAAEGMPVPARHALIAAASTLGIVVPPSLVLILLGDATMAAHTIALHASGRDEQILNTQDLFRGALVPALLFVVACAGIAWWLLRNYGTQDQAKAPRARARTDAWIAFAAVAFVGALLFGVASGRFYAVEGAAAGAFVLFAIAALSGRLRGGALPQLLGDAIATTGALFALLAAATTFTLVFRLLGTDRLLDTWIARLPGGDVSATAVVLGAIALCALALDAFEIIFVMVPVLLPPLLTRVPDATWVAVLVLLTLQASFLVPPIGYAVLMTQGVLGERVRARAMTRKLLPFLLAQVAILSAVLAFPALVHLTQPKAAVSSTPVMSDEEARRAMDRMLAPPSDDPAGPSGTTPPQ